MPKRSFCLWPCSLAITSNGRVGLWFCGFCPGALEGSPAVVLVLKRLRKQGHGLKSHPTDSEKPGIELETPGLQDIDLSPTPRRLLSMPKLLEKKGGFTLQCKSNVSISFQYLYLLLKIKMVSVMQANWNWFLVNCCKLINTSPKIPS